MALIFKQNGIKNKKPVFGHFSTSVEKQ